MPFQFYCPQGHLLEGHEAQMGQQGQCPMCGAMFMFPVLGGQPGAAMPGMQPVRCPADRTDNPAGPVVSGGPMPGQFPGQQRFPGSTDFPGQGMPGQGMPGQGFPGQAARLRRTRVRRRRSGLRASRTRSEARAAHLSHSLPEGTRTANARRHARHAGVVSVLQHADGTALRRQRRVQEATRTRAASARRSRRAASG